MAKNLSNNGIVLNQTIYPQHVSQSVDAFTGADDYDITISGSFTVTGSTSIDGELNVEGPTTMYGNVVAPNLTDTAQSDVVTYNPINGQFYYTSSNAIAPATSSNAISASYSSTASYVQNSQTASYVATASWAFNAVTASYIENAQTASYVLSASYAISSSIADSAMSASYSTTSSFAQDAISSSYAVFAETSSYSYRTTQTDILAINQTGFTIEKGMVVRITGSNNASDIPRITTASYETDYVSANTLGIATQQITNGSQGFIITEGILTGIDTTNYTSGQLIYLGASGSITGSASLAPLHTVRLGQVIRQQSNNGSIHVRIDNGYEIGELHDVIDLTTTSSHGDMLIKSGSVWVNSKQLTGSYGLTGSLLATSFTGSLSGTSSYSTQASTASYVNQLNQTVNISGSLNTTGSVSIYKSGSTVMEISGSVGPLMSVTDSNSGPLLTVATGSTNILVVDSSLVTTITGSLNVQNGITSSLFGTASWATNSITASYVSLSQTSSFVTLAQTASYALNAVSSSYSATASYITLAQTASYVVTANTASYVLNAISASFASTSSYVNQLNQTVNISGSLNTTGSINIYKSGSTVFSISGSQGTLFDVSDVTSGPLFTVWTGSTPIIQVNSSLTTTITGSLDVQNGITGSLLGTSSYSTQALSASWAPSPPSNPFPYTGSALISGSLFITSSLSQTTSSLSVNLPSGSSSISYNVPLSKYKQFSYLTTTRPVYQDDYINLGYDSSGNDFEMDINTDPVSGRVQVHAFSTTATTVTATSDLIVASVTTDIYPNGISSDSRLEITVHAGLDPNYPFYKITAYRSNTTYGGNISVLVERFFPNH